MTLFYVSCREMMLIILMGKRQINFKKMLFWLRYIFFLFEILSWVKRAVWQIRMVKRKIKQKLLWIGDAHLGSLKGGQAILTNCKDECGISECLQRWPKRWMLWRVKKVSRCGFRLRKTWTQLEFRMLISEILPELTSNSVVCLRKSKTILPEAHFLLNSFWNLNIY